MILIVVLCSIKNYIEFFWWSDFEKYLHTLSIFYFFWDDEIFLYYCFEASYMPLFHVKSPWIVRRVKQVKRWVQFVMNSILCTQEVFDCHENVMIEFFVKNDFKISSFGFAFPKKNIFLFSERFSAKMTRIIVKVARRKKKLYQTSSNTVCTSSGRTCKIILNLFVFENK